MRRTELEVRGREQIEPIIAQCTTLRLGMVSQGMPYILPMVFGYEWTGEYPVFYLHCGMAGRKNDALFDGARLAFEMDIEGPVTGRTPYANGYSREFCCVMGEGTVRFAADNDEKIRCFRHIMLHQTGRSDYTYQPGWLALTRVFTLSADTLSAYRKGMKQI
jgi:nitroimidazol reductase NimA-like FMN-containing flavoprotein (pyridoxamine 5'-phosphate oxidase superfamily)